MEEREKDIQKLCNGVLETNIKSTGDSGSGGCCPFCYKDCRWDAWNVNNIEHEPDCIVLIARGLITNF